MKPVVIMLMGFLCFLANTLTSQELPNNKSLSYYQDTRDLMELVHSASKLVNEVGEIAFNDFRQPGSKWRKGEDYIFVLDMDGNMIVHAEPEMEGKNHIDLRDINGKYIIRGLIHAATVVPDKPEGWFHYQWRVPGGFLPRWKSSFVTLTEAPSGKEYIIGSGMYNDRMEKEFVVDVVKNAINEIEKNGKSAFQLFRDPSGPYLAKDAYIFVIDSNGTELVNPPFPTLEGRNIMDLKDIQGKYLVRDMFDLVRTRDSGWLYYMWPKPGESTPTQKATYVSKARLGNSWVLVGSGVYLTDAPRSVTKVVKPTADEQMKLVRSAAKVMEKKGEAAFPEFRKKGTRWFQDDTYFFVWSMEGVRVFHAANPSGEGLNMRDAKDVLGRPWGEMFLEAASLAGGEGWVHYMYPEPGDLYPTWKSTFVKRVKFPSGEDYILGSGIYNMDMDRSFITDVVEHAAELVREYGKDAFTLLRSKTGPFVFMDTYVFVDDPNGVEHVNPAQPDLEGKNLMALQDVNGKYAAKEYIDVAMKSGSGWVDYYWYRPGESEPVQKFTYVRKVQSGNDTWIIGAGFYPRESTIVPSAEGQNLR